jgi:hypothetical protein
VPEAPASDCCTGSPAPRLTDVAGRAPDSHPFRAARQGHERLLHKAVPEATQAPNARQSLIQGVRDGRWVEQRDQIIVGVVVTQGLGVLRYAPDVRFDG